MFKFTECGIRNLAITQLEKTASCVEKIVWGGKYKIKSLLVQGFGEACNRDETFTAAELLYLQDNLQAVELILKKREEKVLASASGMRDLLSDEELTDHFKELLKDAV